MWPCNALNAQQEMSSLHKTREIITMHLRVLDDDLIWIWTVIYKRGLVRRWVKYRFKYWEGELSMDLSRNAEFLQGKKGGAKKTNTITKKAKT